MLKGLSASRSSLVVAFMSMLVVTARLGSSHLPIEELANFSLEQLINIKVTSVSKREQDLNDASVAIFVLTNEEIRASGATSVRDALRWAVSARGFTPTFADGSETFALVFLPTPGSPVVTKAVGNPNLESEIAWASELGYRVQPTNRTALDLGLTYGDQLEFFLIGQNLLGGGRHAERGWDFIEPLAEVPSGFMPG